MIVRLAGAAVFTLTHTLRCCAIAVFCARRKVALTASLKVDVSTAGVAAPDVSLVAASEVDLRDRAGDDEGALPLEASGGGVFTATFKFLDPAQGPYSLTIVPAEGLALATDPAVPVTVSLESGATNVVEISIVRADANAQ